MPGVESGSLLSPELTISIVSYNTSDDLIACLKSIYQWPPKHPFQVLVVDNGSKDDSVERVKSLFPETKIIETGENLGYGRANNRGLLGRSGRYYAIINSDLILKPASLDTCCDYLEKHRNVGIIGGGLFNPDGTPQMDWAAGELTVWAVACEQLFLSTLMPKSKMFGDYFRSYWPRGDTRILPQICGAFMVVRAELFNQIRGFDESYFMYCEDTDLCKRIRNAGSDCVYLHDSISIHGKGKSSAGRLRSAMVLEHNRSRLFYLNRFYGYWAARTAKSAMVIGAMLRILLWQVVGVARWNGDLLAKSRGYWDVLRGTVAFKIPLDAPES